jgi:hypothetical protein
MKVRALKSFVDGKFGRHSKGDEFELPEGCDWLNAGFVEPVGKEIESAVKPPAQKAVIKKTTARGKKKTIEKESTK